MIVFVDELLIDFYVWRDVGLNVIGLSYAIELLHYLLNEFVEKTALGV
jgi:hypothetical protein